MSSLTPPTEVVGFAFLELMITVLVASILLVIEKDPSDRRIELTRPSTDQHVSTNASVSSRCSPRRFTWLLTLRNRVP